MISSKYVIPWGNTTIIVMCSYFVFDKLCLHLYLNNTLNKYLYFILYLLNLINVNVFHLNPADYTCAY